jgi:hypothetical protein
MRKIVDANCLSDPILEEYLKSDQNNMAVLTEFAGMESFKGDPVKNICQSMKVLCQYPRQVIILKGARQIIRENQTPSSLNVELFIDEDQTKQFAESCNVIKQAEKGNPREIMPIKERGRKATEEMERLRQDAIKAAQGIIAISKTFDPNYLKILRRHDPIPEALGDKIIKDILILSALTIRDHPDMNKVPSARELRNTYIFRYSLCCYLLALDWLEKGGLNNSNVEKIRNDLIDMSYAAYATFFDGILSKDVKLNRIYKIAIYFLEHVFA